MNVAYAFDWSVISEYAPALARGLLNTVIISVVAVAGAFIVGIACGAAAAFGPGWMRKTISGYVALFRYTPLLVQLYFIYYALPTWGIRLSAFEVSAIALILWGGSYSSENFRAAFQAVSPGLLTASRALGMSQARTFQHVTFPLGLRIVLPSTVNISISVLKDTAYLSAIAFAEFTYIATNIVATTFRVFELFLVLGAVYLVLVFLLTLLLNQLRDRLQTRGRVAL